MTIFDIATIGHPELRIRATEVDVNELKSVEMQMFIDDLVETMRHANGAGLAATQVLRHQRICISTDLSSCTFTSAARIRNSGWPIVAMARIVIVNSV